MALFPLGGNLSELF